MLDGTGVARSAASLFGADPKTVRPYMPGPVSGSAGGQAEADGSVRRPEDL